MNPPAGNTAERQENRNSIHYHKEVGMGPLAVERVSMDNLETYQVGIIYHCSVAGGNIKKANAAKRILIRRGALPGWKYRILGVLYKMQDLLAKIRSYDYSRLRDFNWAHRFIDTRFGVKVLKEEQNA